MHFVRGEVTEFFQQDIENRFSSEGDAKTGAWAPLKPATITIRASEGYGPGPINVRSGELKSFMSGPYPVFVDSPGSVIIDVPGDAPPGVEAKFKTAQGGSTNNPLGYGNTPARPVLADLTPAELDFIVHMFDAYVQSVMSLFS